MNHQRMYNLVSVDNKTGDITLLTGIPLTYAECMTIKGKLTEHSFRTITIIEV